MEFTEEKAKEIIAKHNLAKQTFATWKTRGTIPDKYANENYKQAEKVDNSGMVILKRIKDLSEREILNLSLICKVVGITRAQLNDACRGKGRINREDIEKVKVEITRARVEIQNVFREDRQSPSGMEKLIGNKVFKHYVILSDYETEYVKRIFYSMSKSYTLDEADFVKVKDAYVKASIMMSV